MGQTTYDLRAPTCRDDSRSSDQESSGLKYHHGLRLAVALFGGQVPERWSIVGQRSNVRLCVRNASNGRNGVGSCRISGQKTCLWREIASTTRSADRQNLAKPPAWDPYLASFEQTFAARSYKPATLENYRHYLRRSGRLLEVERIAPSELTADIAVEFVTAIANVGVSFVWCEKPSWQHRAVTLEFAVDLIPRIEIRIFVKLRPILLGISAPSGGKINAIASALSARLSSTLP